MLLSLSTSAWVTGRGSHTMAAYSFCNERTRAVSCGARKKKVPAIAAYALSLD